MKTLYITLIFSIFSSLHANNLELSGVYEKWLTLNKTCIVQDLGVAETAETMSLVFGESFNKNDQIRNIQLISSKLLKDKLQITIGFPQIVQDISDFTNEESDDYIKVVKTENLPITLDKSYEVEFYGIHCLKTSSGEVISQKKPLLFGKMKLLAGKPWLAYLKEKFEVDDTSSREFKTFLTSEIPQFKVDSSSFEELVAQLKEVFTARTFKLISMSADIDPEAQQKFNLNYENIAVMDLVKRVASLKNLKYRIDETGVILASAEAFERSRVVRDINGLQLPGLKVDLKTKIVILDAKVCLNSGILEYLICLPNSFEHESVFMTKVKPELIHMGLLLIQSEPLPFKDRANVMNSQMGKQSRLKVEVLWQKDGETIKVDLNKLLIDRSQKDKTTLAEDSWFFAGSFFTERNVYAANLHQSIISLQQHPASVIHYGKEADDPYHSNRGGFEVNDKLCPPMNTEVKLIFSVYK